MQPRILVVDDEPDMLNFLERGLRSSYRVIRASDPAVALAILERDPGLDGLITDQHMGGINGLQLIEKVLATRSHMATVLLSGLDDEAAGAVQADARVLKPVDTAHLREALTSAFERARKRRGG